MFFHSLRRLGRELPPVAAAPESQSALRLPCRLSLTYFPPSMPLESTVAIIICKTKRLSRPHFATGFWTGIIAFMKSRLLQVFFMLILIALVAIPRSVAVDRFATIDEPYWLTAGSDFYYALGKRAFANTVYDYHPAVTTMWVVALAMLIYFPQYRGFGQGYFDVYKDTLERFLLAHGRTPLGLLTTGRIIQALLIVVLLLVVFWFLRRLLGGKTAWMGIALISFDPFFLGHSRLLNHEGMLSLFVLISLLAALTYLFSERRLIYLLMSGAAAGFAQLTKSSSLVLVPIIGLLLLFDLFLRREASWKKRVGIGIAELTAWFVMLCAVYFIFWPGMWVAPGEMLYQVFGNAFSYAFEGARLSVTGSVQPTQFRPNLGDVLFYLHSVLWRTTPIVWIGSLLGFAALVRQKWEGRIIQLSIFLLGFMFVLLFGIASGRNSLHYVLSFFVTLDVIAAAGLVQAAEWLENRASKGVRPWLPTMVVLGAGLAIQAVSALLFFPYYYTYYNPIMTVAQYGGQNPGYGYGEGLELAAKYLGGMPDSQDMTVMAYYGRGPFSYFFPGTTEQLKNVYADAENLPQLTQELSRSDYLVIYYQFQKTAGRLTNILGALDNIQPAHTIWLKGVEYVRIYRVSDLPPSFYETVQENTH